MIPFKQCGGGTVRRACIRDSTGRSPGEMLELFVLDLPRRTLRVFLMECGPALKATCNKSRVVSDIKRRADEGV